MGIVVIVIPTKSVVKLFFPVGIYFFKVSSDAVDVNDFVQVL